MEGTMRSPNVSVTPINVEPYAGDHAHHYHHHNHHHHHQRNMTPTTTTERTDLLLDSSDAEVAQIDFQSSTVNLRGRKKTEEGVANDIPRPMSWEGELSDTDREMCVDDEQQQQQQKPPQDNTNVPENLSSTRRPSPAPPDPPKQQPPQHHYPHQQQQPGGTYSLHSTPSNSPLLGQRHVIGAPPPAPPTPASAIHRALNVPPTPSPDSAVHSAYSVFSSPTQSPLTQRHLTLTPNLSRNNSDASHSSCCSYSSASVSVSPTQQFSPTHSPIQNRHMQSVQNSPLHNNVLYRSLQEDSNLHYPSEHDGLDDVEDKTGLIHASLPSQPGISRQQLINSPCPICGDKISGFHYGIFSCESCKGFFKRTVQNRKNYVCLKGAVCPVTVTTRKKCPACRFDKCLQRGMRLDAIREDRTRGGRSTYQCAYSLPASLTSYPELRHGANESQGDVHNGSLTVKLEPIDHSTTSKQRQGVLSYQKHGVPPLLQEIMDVEHLWHYNEMELHKLNETKVRTSSDASTSVQNISKHPLLASTALAGSRDTSPDFLANLCNIADHRLLKIVKWCKSLPLFKNISIDDQICLLINSWCELLLFSCCFRSISTPGEIRVSQGKSINLPQAKDMGVQACIERMLNFTEQLRRLKVDQYEYVAMKVIVLLTSDTAELRDAEKVRMSQEKALQALQDYTLAHYPESPAKFGELLLRIPDLQRTCNISKEMLTTKSKDGEGPSFNLLMELLRGDH